MYTLKIKENYSSKLDVRKTERAIKLFKDTLEIELANALNLERVSAPLMVIASSGLNDDLTGIERIVRFDTKEIRDYDVEIVQSLAKWKRMALYNYGFKAGEGIYTDMNAIRRDDAIDNTHSVYVDQWDWELIISKKQRNIEFLKQIVQKIVTAIADAQDILKRAFSEITASLFRDVFFITAQELFNLYPKLSAKERENKITREKQTVFLMQIGDKLENGERHDGRAPDYDDWMLNGDLLFWNGVLDEAIEISSMGIRVDAESMDEQLKKAGMLERKQYAYHRAVLDDVLPLTIGGGIGQSRLCQLVLEKLHIGEVQASVWPKQMLEDCKKAGIHLL